MWTRVAPPEISGTARSKYASKRSQFRPTGWNSRRSCSNQSLCRTLCCSSFFGEWVHGISHNREKLLLHLYMCVCSKSITGRNQSSRYGNIRIVTILFCCPFFGCLQWWFGVVFFVNTPCRPWMEFCSQSDRSSWVLCPGCPPTSSKSENGDTKSLDSYLPKFSSKYSCFKSRLLNHTFWVFWGNWGQRPLNQNYRSAPDCQKVIGRNFWWCWCVIPGKDEKAMGCNPTAMLPVSAVRTRRAFTLMCVQLSSLNLNLFSIWFLWKIVNKVRQIFLRCGGDRNTDIWTFVSTACGFGKTVQLTTEKGKNKWVKFDLQPGLKPKQVKDRNGIKTSFAWQFYLRQMLAHCCVAACYTPGAPWHNSKTNFWQTDSYGSNVQNQIGPANGLHI